VDALQTDIGIWPRRWSLWFRWRLLSAFILGSVAVWHAASLEWLCDDAFASFRYAQNWARGLGLVFNAHERVEGITNPLWTMGLGILARWGFDIERSSLNLGILAYAASVVCLVLAPARQWTNKRGWLLPMGAVLAVADPDLATFATGGLETSAFTLSILVSFLLAWIASSPISGALAGLCIGVCGMLRPDGALLIGPLALAFLGRRKRGMVPYLAASILPLGAFHVWRHGYYGTWLPNTYYAKSAFLSWWTQGFSYLGYFAIRHAAIIGVAVAASFFIMGDWLVRRMKHSGANQAERTLSDDAVAWRLVVAWAMILGYTLSVVRVGGDFMYARLLVPVLPLLLVVLELSVASVLGARPLRWAALLMVLSLATFLSPCPVDTNIAAHGGIVDERAYYQLGYAQFTERAASQLSNCIQGFPVRAAIYGGELRLAYRTRIPYVIEAHAGLTDPVIAHRPITSRQRVGHEKSADAGYLVLTKKAHFATSPLYGILSDPKGFIPEVHANLCGADVRLLHWDPIFVSYVRSRGAQVPEFTVWLDDLLARLDTMSDTGARAQWDAVRHFYFAHNSDPVRERAFLARLERSNPSYP